VVGGRLVQAVKIEPRKKRVGLLQENIGIQEGGGCGGDFHEGEGRVDAFLEGQYDKVGQG